MLNQFKSVRTSPFDSYRLYMAVKLHFSGSYDAIKYQFKTSAAKSSTFEAHKNRFFFERVARRYSTQDQTIAYYVWNVIEGNDWIGSMKETPLEQKRAYLESYSYNIKSEIEAMKSKGTFDSLLFPYNGLQPKIFDLVDDGSISLETVTVINTIVNFLDSSNFECIEDALGMFESKKRMVIKYQPFLKDIIDYTKIRSILISGFTSPTQ